MRIGFGLLVLLIAASAASRAGAGLMVPVYNSFPSASAKIYLDFDGDNTPDYGNYHPGVTPAYSTDADVDNFSATELENIHKVWMGVAEKYSPFKINVTTVDPNSQFSATRVVIGGAGNWAPPNSGGIGIEGSWANPGFPNLAFVFPGHLDNGNPRYVAEASAHEAGHGFGLNHQSLYENNNLILEYNPGDANRAPIMGKSYYATRGMWWLGPTPDTLGNQDDLKIISSKGITLANGFGYRTDDHPSDPLVSGDALLLGSDLSIGGQGVIEHSDDMDFFNFVTAGGPAKIVADVAPFAPMLDLSLGLYDESGNLLASSATASLGEGINTTLAPGTYKVGISSAGGYSDLGQYIITGFVPEPSSLTALALLAGLVIRRNPRRLL